MSLEACRTVDLQRFADPRGNLTFIEGGVHIPFEIARVYYIWGIPDAAIRGAHGHRELQQFLVAVSGQFDVQIDDGRETRTIHLDRPDQGLYIAPMIWRDVVNFSDGSVCLCMASLPYDEADYFRDYDDFLAASRVRP